MNKTLISLSLFSMVIIGSCSHKYTYVVSKGEGNITSATNQIGGINSQYDSTCQEEVIPVVEKRTGMVLKATAFKMNGDYSDNVAVTLGPDGRLTYFPAPSDISSASKPVSVGNGWWLNCQGIGPNSVFTKYTFDEYSALPAVPSIAEIKAAIIPGSGVTEFIQLPWNSGEAEANIKEVKNYLKDK